MPTLRFFLLAVCALGSVCCAQLDAAILTIRLTAYDAANVQTGTFTITSGVVSTDPIPANLDTGNINLSSDFELVVAGNTADSPDGSGGTSHGITVRIFYSGLADTAAPGDLSG